MSSTDSLPAFVTQPGQPRKSSLESLTVRFDDNALARSLFGQFDENLAILERDLNIEAATRGNEVTLKGSSTAIGQASAVLNLLYDRLTNGEDITAGDVDGAIRQTTQGAARVQPGSDAARHNQSKGGPSAKPAAAGTASISTARKTIHSRTPTQSAYIEALARSEMVFGTGPAGTGKTYLAVAFAASLLERGAVDRIILSRPAVEAGERLGFLPGDMKEKVDPYLRPLYDALYDMMPAEKVDRAITSGIIEIAPLAFMRGRTLSHSVIILDEAQNTTTMQMKMFLTRLGEGSKMIITGDTSQIDLPYGQTSGLVDALNILTPVKGIETIAFSAEDVVRHKLVGRIVDAYDRAAASKLSST